MNSERLHTGGVAPEFTDAQKEYLKGLSPEQFEQLRASFKKDVAPAVKLAMEVDGVADAEKDEYLQQGMDNLPDATLDATVAQFDAENGGGADVNVADTNVDAVDADVANANVEPKPAATELNNMSDDDYEKLLDAASRGEDVEVEDANGNKVMVNASKRLSQLQNEQLNTVNGQPDAGKDSVDKVDDVNVDNNVDKVDDTKTGEDVLDTEAKNFNEWAMGRIDQLETEVKEANKRNEKLEASMEMMKEAYKKLEENYTKLVENLPTKRKGRIKRILGRVKAAALVALIALTGPTVGAIANSTDATAVEQEADDNGGGVYNEWAASGVSRKTAETGSTMNLGQRFDMGNLMNANTANTDPNAKVENLGGSHENENNKAENVSSTAKFKIGGKEFSYDNKKHEGGYEKGMDGFYDDDKDGEHSMMGHAYEGKWKGTPKQTFETFRGLMAGLKGSPEIAKHIAMAADLPGGMKVHSLSQLNDSIDGMRERDPEAFDKIMTKISDSINEFADGGEMKVSTIEAGKSYLSSYTENLGGDLVVRIDDNGVAHDYDVHVVDLFDKDGKSMFNSDEAKTKIREMFGLPKTMMFKAGWSAECGQVVVYDMVKIKSPKIKVKIKDTPRIEAELIGTPVIDEIPDEPEDDIPDDDIPNGTPEDGTPEGTPETVVTIPAIPSNPDSTPETVVFTSTPTTTPETTPETTPSQDQDLDVKTGNTRGGNAANVGSSEDDNPDTNVEAGDKGNVDTGVAPGAATPPTNTEGVNNDAVNSGNLNQPEDVKVPESQADENSKNENMQHGGSTSDLVERMNQQQ